MTEVSTRYFRQDLTRHEVGGTFADCVFIDVHLQEGTRFVNCLFTECQFTRITADDETIFVRCEFLQCSELPPLEMCQECDFN